jgi:hypothetical protein
MARPPSDEEFTEFVVASWPSLYRTAYAGTSFES